MTAKSVRVTTLCENTATFGCVAEFGLSLFIEVDDYKILFDTGMTRCARENAAFLDVDLRQTNTIVLSHGHVDHTGGLMGILDAYGPKDVVVHPHIWHEKLSNRNTESYRDIGMLFTHVEYEKAGAQFQIERSGRELFPNIFISGEVPMKTSFEQVDEGLFTRENNQIVEDKMIDETSLAVVVDEGLIVFAGCAHRGIINIVKHFQMICGEQRIVAIVGGFHLGHASNDHIEKTIAALKEMNPTQLACSHCTGRNASCMIARAFPNSFVPNYAGTKLCFPSD